MILLAFLIAGTAIVAAGSHPRVDVQNGSIVGKVMMVSDATANAYLGIPFAKPPTRFLAPEAPDAISGEYDGTTYKSSCMQTGTSTGLSQYYGNVTVLDNYSKAAYNSTNSEDCLYLNVYVPLNATATSKLPVLFSIYGGNLNSGSGSFAAYNGVPFAAHQNVIVVTPNYRIGVFGFTPSPELEQRNPGFLDQRLALSWVAENIASFGGDPTKVAIEGQSAGAYSVKQLWANPPEPLTFSAAIIQSESLILPSDGWPALTQLLNCSTADSPLACVQAVDAATVVSVSQSNALTFPPTVDHITHTDHVEVAIANGAAAQIPILIGTNGDEAASLYPGINKTTGELVWEPATGVTSPSFDEIYNATVEAWGDHTTAHILNQYGFTCRAQILATRAAENGIPVWRYFYNATFPVWDSYAGESTYGPQHGAELSLLFGTYPRSGNTTNAARVSKYLQDTFGSFVRDPVSGASWPAVNSAPEYLLKIDNQSGGGDVVESNGLIDGDCGLYDAVLISTGVVKV